MGRASDEQSSEGRPEPRDGALGRRDGRGDEERRRRRRREKKKKKQRKLVDGRRGVRRVPQRDRGDCNQRQSDFTEPVVP
jgi:hypothetical protein